MWCGCVYSFFLINLVYGVLSFLEKTHSNHTWLIFGIDPSSHGVVERLLMIPCSLVHISCLDHEICVGSLISLSWWRPIRNMSSAMKKFRVQLVYWYTISVSIHLLSRFCSLCIDTSGKVYQYTCCLELCDLGIDTPEMVYQYTCPLFFNTLFSCSLNLRLGLNPPLKLRNLWFVFDKLVLDLVDELCVISLFVWKGFRTRSTNWHFALHLGWVESPSHLWKDVMTHGSCLTRHWRWNLINDNVNLKHVIWGRKVARNDTMVVLWMCR